jgi:hypothetical protein
MKANENITGRNAPDHQGQCMEMPHITKRLEKEQDQLKFSYESWANASYRLTFQEMLKDPAFAAQIKGGITRYFDTLDRIIDRLREEGGPGRDKIGYVYNCLFDLMAFSFTRITNDPKHEIVQHIGRCAEGRLSLLKTSLEDQRTERYSCADTDTFLPYIFSNMVENVSARLPGSEERSRESNLQRLLKQKWQLYLGTDESIAYSYDKFAFSQKRVAAIDLAMIRSALDVSTHSHHLSHQGLVPLALPS